MPPWALPPDSGPHKLLYMSNSSRDNDVTVIEFGSAYESLDDDCLEEVGGLLLTKAATVEPPLLVLDLSRTTYMGSTFIELLVRTWKRLTERGGQLALCGLQPFCAEIIRVTHLDSIWDIFPTREEAVESLSSRAV